MPKRTLLLAAAYLLAATGLAYFAGVFAGRSGVLQFFGHLGPAMLFVGAGPMSISRKIDTRRLVRPEAYLALGVALLYLLVDTFIILPPFGIFDGAGTAEQQHVSLNLILVGLASFVLVTLRYTEVLPSVQILIAAAAFAVVFPAHGQHNETTVFLVLAAVLRILDRMFEYGMILLIDAHTFFRSQIGLTLFTEDVGIDLIAWSSYWITAASLVVASYLAAMRQQPREIL